MKSVLILFLASVVLVSLWLVGFPSLAVSGWWKVMPSSTDSSANAIYRLLIVGFWSALLFACRLESGHRPFVWFLFVVIVVCLRCWWLSHRCWLVVVVVICWLNRCAAVGSSGEDVAVLVYRLIVFIFVFVFSLAVKTTVFGKMNDLGRILHYFLSLVSCCCKFCLAFVSRMRSVGAGNNFFVSSCITWRSGLCTHKSGIPFFGFTEGGLLTFVVGL